MRREQRSAPTIIVGAEQRMVLSLFAVEGLRHGGIAEVLGIPEGTVWSRLHAARKALAIALGPDVRR